jgi:Na+-translocating ferredoxin:NAD+ oxidoreductase RnfD subunit
LAGTAADRHGVAKLPAGGAELTAFFLDREPLRFSNVSSRSALFGTLIRALSLLLRSDASSNWPRTVVFLIHFRHE